MRIGVITFWNSQDNYGQLLQCFAMQRYLRSLGHEPFLIRYSPSAPSVQASFKLSGIFRYITNIKTYVKLYLLQRQSRKYNQLDQSALRDFNGFRSQYIKMSEQVYNELDLTENPPQAEAYICGSDQIWGSDEIMHLSFAPDKALKIAYAPSFGGITSFSPEMQAMLKRTLARFDFIGMREQSGVNTCKEFGYKDAVKVVDPTLLLSKADYTEVAKKPQSNNYAFVYLLGNPICCSTDEIFNFINRKQMDYVYVASQGRVDRYQKTYATINEWIGYVSQAKVVITNSFHCVVFSLIFNKPFICIPLSDTYQRMNGRIEELLDIAELSSQIFAGNFDDINLQPDFSRFNAYQQEQQLRSTSLLQKYLK
jgi:hypothetical protein